MALVNDDFTTLDQWADDSSDGSAALDSGALKVEVTAQYGTGRVKSNDQLSGDFDVSVDWSLGTNPGAGESWTLGLAANLFGEAGPGIYIQSSGGYAVGYGFDDEMEWVATSATSGKIRLTRIIDGESQAHWQTYYNEGDGWVPLSTFGSASQTGDVWISLAAVSMASSYSLIGHFDNFLAGPPPETATIDAPLSAALPYASGELYGNIIGSILSAAIPGISATPWWVSLDVNLSGVQPVLTALTNKFAQVDLVLGAALPHFAVTTGRSSSVSVLLSAVLPVMSVSTGRVADLAVLLSAPVPALTGLIHGFATFSVPLSGAIPGVVSLGAVRAICVNLFHRGVTEYLNYPFNSLVEHEGEYYGITTDEGIFVLTGATDAGTDIDAFLESGNIDFGNGFESMIEDAWILARTPGDMALTLFADDDETGDTYTDSGDPAGSLASLRFEPDKGVTGHTWRYRIANVDGGDFSVQQLQFLVSNLSRKR